MFHSSADRLRAWLSRFEDILGGGRRGRTRSQRGADLRYDMALTFEEGAAGVTTKIKVPRQEFCESCKGAGAKAVTFVDPVVQELR